VYRENCYKQAAYAHVGGGLGSRKRANPQLRRGPLAFMAASATVGAAAGEGVGEAAGAVVGAAGAGVVPGSDLASGLPQVHSSVPR
jgi:hypothetical protein